MGYLLLLLAASAGAAFALQGPINGGLARYVGGAMPAAVVSFAIGSLSLLVAFVATSWGQSNLKAAGAAPPQLLIAGIFGAFGITAMAFVVPRVGTGSALSAMIFGQLVVTVLAERFGWFLGSPAPIEPRRWAGVAAMAVGVWLLRQ